MRKIAIESSHKVTLRLVTGGKEESGYASSPFGPLKAGLITMRPTKEDQQLTELLNCLENVVENLNYKSFEVYDTLTIAIEAARVALSSGTTDTAGTNVNGS